MSFRDVSVSLYSERHRDLSNQSVRKMRYFINSHTMYKHSYGPIRARVRSNLFYDLEHLHITSFRGSGRRNGEKFNDNSSGTELIFLLLY